MGTDRPIRILLIEDLPSDAQLAVRELWKGGIEFETLRAETGEAVQEALREYRPDLVISDYALPRFDGMRALELCREHDPLLPFIVLTGSMNEDTAVACMKAGAADYVIKEHITRLPFAVKEALNRRRILEQQRAVERALQDSEQRFRRLAEDAPDMVYRLRLHPERSFEYVSPSATFITGYTPEEYYADPGLEGRLVHPDDRALLDAVTRGELPVGRPVVLRWVRKDGAVIWAEQRTVPFFDESGNVVATEGIVRDITERKRAEARIEHLNRLLRAIRGVSQLIVREKNRERLIQRACETLVEMRGFGGAWIVLTGLLPARLDSGQAGMPEPEFSRFTGLFSSGPLPRCCRGLETRPAVILTRETAAACVGCPLAGCQRRCALTASVRHEEHLYGYLGVSVPESLEADHEELTLLQEVAADLGLALHGMDSEEARRQSEQSLRAIFDNVRDGILVADAETRRLVNANRAMCRMVGLSLEEIRGLSVADIHPAESREYATAEFERQLQGKTALTRDIPVRRKDGGVFYADVNAAPLELNGRGHLLGVFRDVTQRRRAEQKLREANERLQAVQQHLALQARWVQALNSVARDIARRNNLESILRVVMSYLEESFAFLTGGIVLRAADGSGPTAAVLTSRGRSVAKRLGLKEGMKLAGAESLLPAGLVPTQPLILTLAAALGEKVPGPAGALLRRAVALGLRSAVVVPLATNTDWNGALIMLYRQAAALSEPELAFLRGMAEYVSLARQNRRLYEELEGSYRTLQATQQVMMRQERMKAMGQMASGIAHDINNTLAPITLYAEALAASELGQKEPARRYLGAIQSAAGDIEGITMRLRAFYKEAEQGETELLDVEELFDSVQDLSRPRWKDIPNRQGVEIRFVRQVPSRLPPLPANLTEVREALINLVFNAADALPQGGAITLRARRRGERLCLEVADTGVGMNEEQKRRCLEPFYTTKGAAGSGLGMSVAFGTMQRHRGEMEIESSPGRGTTVRLLFPLPQRPPEETPATGDRPDAVLPPLRILCIDDNPQVREVLREMLARNGHHVRSCADGEEALEVFRSSMAGQEPFDVVITDLGMPHMDGKALARGIKELSPGTPVILLSGWGNFMNVQGELPENVDRLLGKPPTMARLLAAIAEVVAASPADRPDAPPRPDHPEEARE